MHSHGRLCVQLNTTRGHRSTESCDRLAVGLAIVAMATGADEVIGLRGAHIDGAGAVRIATALKLNIKITSVNLAGGCLGGTRACGVVVRVGFTLAVSGNDIGAAGAGDCGGAEVEHGNHARESGGGGVSLLRRVAVV